MPHGNKAQHSAGAAVLCGGPTCPPTHRIQHVTRLAAAAAGAGNSKDLYNYMFCVFTLLSRPNCAACLSSGGG